MTEQICACPHCECATTGDQAVERDGQRFCCEACAEHHVNHQHCQSPGCHCEEAAEKRLDEAVEETFPASDPISP
ncbi:metallothionein [Pseudomonas viridiflava]|uniref:metallothionein n=1 Tax=Pseudomonas syringae group TaxID=136849 RepID=UPI0015E29AA7|nr:MULTISPECIES: metallothionein [Pseudomonas syringae group]MBA1228949.1 metallothionein [Pseudomonas viridiflava]MCF5707165.1 metallothionein [Pseudomonas syringae]